MQYNICVLFEKNKIIISTIKATSISQNKDILTQHNSNQQIKANPEQIYW